MRCQFSILPTPPPTRIKNRQFFFVFSLFFASAKMIFRTTSRTTGTILARGSGGPQVRRGVAFGLPSRIIDDTSQSPLKKFDEFRWRGTKESAVGSLMQTWAQIWIIICPFGIVFWDIEEPFIRFADQNNKIIEFASSTSTALFSLLISSTTPRTLTSIQIWPTVNGGPGFARPRARLL